MSYLFERKINYYETDKMGVVHHSNYVRFLEEARCEYMNALDLPYKSLEDNGILIPVLGVNCVYKSHVTYGDTLEINLHIAEFTGVRMTVKYTLTNKETGTLVMTAETKHCFTDQNLKPLNMKKNFPDIFEKFVNTSLTL